MSFPQMDLALSAPSWAATWSTMAWFVTGSLPSIAEGLLFLRSCTVPFCLQFFKSLLRGWRWAGGGAFTFPHVLAGHLIMSFRQEEMDFVFTSEHIQRWSVPKLPPKSSFLLEKSFLPHRPFPNHGVSLKSMNCKSLQNSFSQAHRNEVDAPSELPQ